LNCYSNNVFTYLFTAYLRKYYHRGTDLWLKDLSISHKYLEQRKIFVVFWKKKKKHCFFGGEVRKSNEVKNFLNIIIRKFKKRGAYFTELLVFLEFTENVCCEVKSKV